MPEFQGGAFNKVVGELSQGAPFADIGGAFRQGRERLETRQAGEAQKLQSQQENEAASEIVKSQLGFQFAKLADLNPEAATKLAGALKIPTNATDRLKNAAGIIVLSSKLLQADQDPKVVATLLSEQAAQLNSGGVATELLNSTIEGLLSDDPAIVANEVNALGQLAATLSGPGKPLSPEGKLQSDITKGLLTQEQLQKQVGDTGSFGGLKAGVDDEGNKVFFQVDRTGKVNKVEGFSPAQSDASINRETKKLELQAKDDDRDRQSREQASIVVGNVNQAINQIGVLTAGFFGNITSSISGSPAFDLSQTLVTIKSNVGFNKLQKMREASPTGGALGQVSDRENRLLQSVLGSFDQGQSPGQLRTNLKRVGVIFDSIVNGPEQAGFSGFVFSKADFNKVQSGELYINGKTGDVARKP